MLLLFERERRGYEPCKRHQRVRRGDGEDCVPGRDGGALARVEHAEHATARPHAICVDAAWRGETGAEAVLTQYLAVARSARVHDISQTTHGLGFVDRPRGEDATAGEDVAVSA